jgi:hypothetical protein
VFPTRLELDMEALHSLATSGRAGSRRKRVDPALAWLRERVATTPGRLLAMSAVVVAVAICYGVVATVAVRSRAQAAQAVQTQTEPLLKQAASLYTALSDANATVTTTLLRGGLELRAERARYMQDLAIAAAALTTLTREAGTSANARPALRIIADELPLYSGLVEAARADNRQNFPIGASYLREASSLLTTTMLPAADRLYTAEARRLTDNYGSGTGTGTLIALLTAAAVSLVLLVLAQRYVAQQSRRILNVPMLAATVVVGVASIWALVGLLSEQNALASARSDGSDSVEVLSATQVLLSRALGDQSLTLVNRGGDESDPTDVAAVMPVVGRLISEDRALAARTGTTTSAGLLTREFASYRSETAQIGQLEKSGRITQAISPWRAAGVTSAQLNANLTDQILAAQNRFVSSANDATSAVSGLSLAIPLLTVIAGVLALLGLRQRINEYR